MFVHRKHGLFLSVYVDDIKMAAKKQNMTPMWKMMKNVDIDEPSSFLDHENLGGTQREFKPNQTLLNVNSNRNKHSLNIIRRCLNHVFLLEHLKNFQFGRILRHGGTCSEMR